MEASTIIIGIIIIGGAIFVIDRIIRAKKAIDLDAIEKVKVGKYLTGFPDADNPTEWVVDCVITDKSFVFISGFGNELGRISRNSINQILIDIKSQISQRLTATRMLTMGIFALAAPKKKNIKEYCLIIDWDDYRGVKNNTVFEFADEFCESSANKAANILSKYIKPKAINLKPGQRKCPYCAEIIKREAKICRFCKSKL